MQTKQFFAPGKVMLCGEYAVIAGIEALSLPTKRGQTMQVWNYENTEEKIHVESKNAKGEIWFDGIFSNKGRLLQSKYNLAAKRIQKLLEICLSLNHGLIKEKESVRLEIKTEFNRNWGLGSSSSLVSLFSQWSGVDVLILQQEIFSGSGYDAATCFVQKPLIYWLENEISNWAIWNCPLQLMNHWRIVFLGAKTDSRKALQVNKEKLELLKTDVIMKKQLQTIIDKIKVAENIQVLEFGLEMWSAILSAALDLPSAYSDLQLKPVQGGLCKYLGAWGGDMILVNELFYNQYEKLKEYESTSWNELVAD